ncbi:MAG: hypothetical protein EB114_08985 [Betaproteobacteria bacterium]|nr:hypothetical protein [Betaproteobacteria bacterium]
MKTVAGLIGALKVRQAEISQSLAAGNAATWEAYQRMVGEFLGLQKALDVIDDFLRNEDE